MKPFNEQIPNSTNQSNAIAVTENFLKEVIEYIKIGNFKKVRFLLSQSLLNLNDTMGKEILQALPTEMNKLKPRDLYDDFIDLAKSDDWVNAKRNYKKTKRNDKDYLSIIVYVSPSTTSNLQARINSPSLLNPKKEELVEITPGLINALVTFNTYSEIPNISFEIPFNNFYIKISGYGTESNKKSLLDHISKIDFEKIKTAVKLD